MSGRWDSAKPPGAESEGTACHDGAFGALPRPSIALDSAQPPGASLRAEWTSTELQTGFASAGVITVLSSRTAGIPTEKHRRYKRPTRLSKLVGRLLNGAGQLIVQSPCLQLQLFLLLQARDFSRGTLTFKTSFLF